MNYKRRAILFGCLLTFVTIWNFISSTGISLTKYQYDPNLAGHRCKPSETAFEDENVFDPAACVKLCHHRKICRGVFYQPESNKCIGCRADIVNPNCNTEAWPGSQYFQLVNTPHYNFFCYNWTKKDNDTVGPARKLKALRQQCESYRYHVFTKGKNEDYPNCGTCWCCQRIDYGCYFWTDGDYDVMGRDPHRTVADEKARCEDDLGFVYTNGKNECLPGSDGCSCLTPPKKSMSQP